jgi:hypothetical protein
VLIELAVGQVVDDTTSASRDDHAQRKDHPYMEPELAHSMPCYGQSDPGWPQEHDPPDRSVESGYLDPERKT